MRAVLVSCLLAAASVITGCASSGGSPTATTVDVSVTSCGQGWHPSTAGPQHLVLHNTDTRAGEVQLIAPATGAVYADVEPLGPGTTDPLEVTLGAGRYAVRCVMEDEAPVTGPVVALAGRSTGAAAGIVPVSEAQLIGPTKKYEAYVAARLPALVSAVDRLRADLGTPSRARADWLAAHLQYERLGGAYGAFGDLDAAINGTHPSAGWTGFHRVESQLWHGAPPADLTSSIGTLRADLATLTRRWRTVQLDPLELTIRAHEITENALEFALSGRDDFGSHSGLATVRANLDGTTTVLDDLGPLVPNRAAIDRAITAAETLLDAHLHTPLEVLATTDREHINAAISELTELLAPVASQLEPRRTS